MPLSQLFARLRKSRQHAEIEKARNVEEYRGIKESLLAYEIIRARYPTDPDVYAEEAACLVRARRLEDADTLLKRIIWKFPLSERLWRDFAQLAVARGNWNDARARWENFRARFPDQPLGAAGLAEALRHLEKPVEAGAVMDAARKEWADDETLAVAYAKEANERQDWPEAERRWGAVRAGFPQRLDGYIEAAKAAQSGGSGSGAAAHILEEALEKLQPHSSIATTCIETAAALTRARQFDEAEKLLAAAALRFPKNPTLLVDYAQAAMHRLDWAAAVARWQEFRTRFPDKPHGYCSGIVALRGAGKLDEAEKLALEAMPLFPDDFRIWNEYGIVAQTRRDWPEALRRFAELREKFPARAEGYTSAANALAQTKQHAQAAVLLEVAAQLFPDDERVAVERVWNACNLKDWPETISRAAAVRSAFPNNPEGYSLGTLALLREGKIGEAETLAAAGLQLLPRNVFLLSQYASCAEQRRDWDTAIKRWEQALAVAPTNQSSLTGLAGARHARSLGVADGSHSAAETDAAAPEAAAAETNAAVGDVTEEPEFLRRFESLGDNCEFGLVQRLCGQEPLGLLRWATTYAHKLVAALQARFAGVGAVENTTVYINPASEWSAADTRYFSMHTFIYDLKLDPDALIKQMARRFEFLKNKLIEDLEAGEKIFIYKRHDGVLPTAQMLEILAELKQYHPGNRLLAVRKPELPEQDGTVIDAGGGLLIGHLSDLSADPQAVRRYFGKWIALCKSAWRLAQSPEEDSEIIVEWRAADSYATEAEQLQKAREWDRAEALLQEALKIYPGSDELLKRHALLAEDRGDRLGATERWQRWVSASDSDPGEIGRCCATLRQAKRFDEAETLAAAAIVRFPKHVHLGLEYALVAQFRRDSKLAMERWELFRERHPRNIDGYVYGAHASREAGEFDEAERLAQLATERFPGNERGWMQLAFVSQDKRAWAETAARWRTVRERFPDVSAGYLWGAFACNKFGQATEAEQIYRTGTMLFPDSPELAHEYANAAATRNDWREALKRWEAAARKFPNFAPVQLGAGRAAHQLQLAALDNPASDNEADTADRQGDLLNLMMSFEGLGDNCEFGLVQRRFKAEPLGLLRWTGIGTEQITRALENRFPSTGDPENTWMTVSPGGEYYVRDRVNQFFMHTFIQAKDSDADAQLRLQCRRLRFLREKLLRDLQEAEKIFVYKPRAGLISDDELRALRAAVRSYGPTNLLCIRMEDAEHPNGVVEWVDEGLLLGYIDRLSPQANASEVAYDSWLAICQKARRLVDERASAGHGALAAETA